MKKISTQENIYASLSSAMTVDANEPKPVLIA